MDLPEHAPGVAAIVRALPVPFQCIFVDTIPDHPLLTRLSFDNGITTQDHVLVLKFTCEIEIGPIAVHPCLAPETAFRIIRGNAYTAEIWRAKIFLNNLAIKDAFDAVRPFSIVSPCHIPFAE